MRLRSCAAISIALLLMLILLSGCVYIPGELTGISLLPIVQTFEASPAVIKDGEHSTLSWSVTGASKVYIDNNIGNVAIKGSIPVSPGVTTYYCLTASNSSGNTTARTQVIVNGSALPQPKQPVIQYFYADKNYINPGEGVTFNWSTTETTLVTLEPGGPVITQGSKTVYPYVTSDYILSASNSYSIVQNKLTITVNTPGSYQTGTEKVAILSAIPEETGSLFKNNAVYTVQEAACAGDTSLNLASRAFLSFNITGIPPNATIDEAILDLSNYSQTGNANYAGTSMVSGMGALEIYFYPYGGLSNLDIMAYNRPGTLIKSGNITSYPMSPWQLDVKTSATGENVIQNLVMTGQTRCQFRVQFFTSTNWDMQSDMLCFDDAKLIIKYKVP
ncbi:MAG: hypothetical protein EHM12_02580 [Dehalococcoidia bacterium]|nr:MAG: hypothetical protein EHM12_02580 [Dehalococcoidia bacterium]